MPGAGCSGCWCSTGRYLAASRGIRILQFQLDPMCLHDRRPPREKRRKRNAQVITSRASSGFVEKGVRNSSAQLRGTRVQSRSRTLNQADMSPCPQRPDSGRGHTDGKDRKLPHDRRDFEDTVHTRGVYLEPGEEPRNRFRIRGSTARHRAEDTRSQQQRRAAGTFRRGTTRSLMTKSVSGSDVW